MNLHQFKFLQAAQRHELNLTEAAKALHTSQPGVSKAILELEAELGIEIFSRHGKRIKHITEPGREVMKCVDIILREVANLKRIGQAYSAQDQGTLSLAATHTQARYVLPEPVSKLRKLYPNVSISLHQGTPTQVAQMLIEEVAEVGIATESLADYDELITLPCYEWQHMLVMPPKHPLNQLSRITLEDIAGYDLITYHPSFAGRSRIDAAFATRDLHPRIALEAIDSDVIKTYVKLGMGIGILAEMAVRSEDEDLVVHPAGQLFGMNTTRIAFKRGTYLRDFVYQFAELLSDRLNRKLIEQCVLGRATDYEL